VWHQCTPSSVVLLQLFLYATLRTFPQHAYFEPSGAGESGLRRVLQAFALHNPVIGYCQSLNFLTGMMLIFMQEEDAFWLLIAVVERLLPEDYFTKNMVGTYVDQHVLGHIIKKCLPRTSRYENLCSAYMSGHVRCTPFPLRLLLGLSTPIHL
jgi:hypothetical protein